MSDYIDQIEIKQGESTPTWVFIDSNTNISSSSWIGKVKVVKGIGGQISMDERDLSKKSDGSGFVLKLIHTDTEAFQVSDHVIVVTIKNDDIEFYIEEHILLTVTKKG